MTKELVIKAYDFAKEKHGDKKRGWSDLPYFSHPKYVARIVDQMTNDPEMVAAALLHDVIEDCKVTYEELLTLFGKRVADLVLEVSNKIPNGISKSIYMVQKMLDLSDDGLVLKLCDRYHNILFLEGDKVPIDFISKYYKETRMMMVTVKQRPLNANHIHIIQIIEAILNFLQVRYHFEG